MPQFYVQMTALRETTVRAAERAAAMRIAKALAVLPTPFDPSQTRPVRTRVEPVAPGIADLVYDHDADDVFHRYEFLVDADDSPSAPNVAIFVLISGMAEIARVKVEAPDPVLIHFLPQWKRLWRLQILSACIGTAIASSGRPPDPSDRKDRNPYLFSCRTLVETAARIEAEDTRAAAATAEGLLPDRWSALASTVSHLDESGAPTLTRFYADNFEAVDTRATRVSYTKDHGADGAFDLIHGWQTPQGFAALPALRFPLEPSNKTILPELLPLLQVAWTRGFVSDPHRPNRN